MKKWYVLGVMLLACSSVGCENHLVAYYQFNGNADDSSGKGHNGTIKQAVLTYDRFHRQNSAYYFDGSSYIDLPEMELVSNQLTVSYWMKSQDERAWGTDGWSYPINTRSWKPGNVLCGFHNDRSGTNENRGIAVDLYGAEPLYEAFVALYYKTDPLEYFNKWVHVVFTIDVDEKIIALYINGKLVKLTTYKAFPGRIKLKLSIGGNFNADQNNYLGPRNWVGSVDDVAIFNKILSKAEVVKLFKE